MNTNVYALTLSLLLPNTANYGCSIGLFCCCWWKFSRCLYSPHVPFMPCPFTQAPIIPVCNRCKQIFELNLFSTNSTMLLIILYVIHSILNLPKQNYYNLQNYIGCNVCSRISDTYYSIYNIFNLNV